MYSSLEREPLPNHAFSLIRPALTNPLIPVLSFSTDDDDPLDKLMFQDILFDAATGEAKKFILRTNFPGHFDFGVYDRCELSLELGGVNVGVDTEWDDLSNSLFRSGQPTHPVVLNRTSSTENPFGSTFCYGYQDLIFEVIPTNGHIASVTIFSNNY